MTKFMLSTAVVGMLAFPALAQTDASGMFRPEADATELRASDFIGKRVYAAESELNADEYAGVDAGWNDIGEINDVIMTRDGAVAAVLVDIGGFLGMGERTVAVDMKAIRFVSDGSTPDDTNDYFLVMQASRANLEGAPAYGMDGMTGQTTGSADTTGSTDATGTASTDTTGSADATGTASTDTTGSTDATGTMASGNGAAITRDGYVDAEPEILTTERLTGASVYDSTDQRVGEISELQMSDDGKISAAVVDVGGFLGMGERPVALEMNNLAILRNDAGNEVRVYVGMTKEELEALPEYRK